MKPFDFLTPTRICFGPGTFSRAAVLSDRLGRRGLLLADPWLAQNTSRVAELQEAVEKLGGGLSIFSRVSPNPKSSEIDAAADQFRAGQCTHVIGLGGGSVLDAAKAVAACARLERKCAELLDRPIAAGQAFATLLIPTTAGTGSELSKGAIVSFPDRQIKTGLRGDGLFATCALVDPELCLTLPLRVTALTGFDVFTHAVETYLSRKSSPLTDLFAVESMTIVAQCLPRLLGEPGNLELRSRLSFASMLMGINLANSSTCLPHRLQYPIGARTDTAHAAGLAALYPAWFKGMTYAAAGKAAAIMRILQPAAAGDLGAEPMVAILRGFMDALQVGTSLSALGVKAGDIPAFLDQLSGDLSADPGDTSREHLSRIYHASL
jgi:alcohol dehydrogenase class IV